LKSSFFGKVGSDGGFSKSRITENGFSGSGISRNRFARIDASGLSYSGGLPGGRGSNGSACGNSIGQLEMLINQGLEQMSHLYRDGMFSMWKGGTPDLKTTVMVLRNLAPLRRESDASQGIRIVDCAVDELQKRKIRDNLLLPYSPEFSAPMKSVRDAALHYHAGMQKSEALRLIMKSAVAGGEMLRWSDPGCWAGDTEATCHALQVLAAQGEDEMVERGFRFLSTRLVNGMLFSTADTCAFLELLCRLAWKGSARAVTDGREREVDSTVTCTTVKAIDRALVRVDCRKEVDYLDGCDLRSGVLKVDRTSLQPGGRGVIEITPAQSSIAPIARIYLPGNIALVTMGADVQKAVLPIENGSLRLEFYATRKGSGLLRTAIHDMYNPAIRSGDSLPIFTNC